VKRILVTGATGCVGRQALPLLLEHGWDVHAVTLEPAPADLAGPQWHEADLLDAGAARRVVAEARADALLHLAWSVTPGQWASALENLDWVAASLALGRAFRDAGGRRIVVAGSCLEYDWDYGLCSERLTPCRPHTLYGTSKHALRLLLEAYSRETGVALAWGRIFFLYGPWEHPDRLIASVVRSLLRGERARCSHGRQIRDYLYAGDVAAALVALLESEVTGAVNIASGQAITLRELASRAGRLLQLEDRIDFGAIPAAPTDKPLVVADVSRLSTEVQWRPRVTLDDGLGRTIAWWRDRLAANPR
jgi:nucleoside-diphosphate-sugar epimerase